MNVMQDMARLCAEFRSRHQKHPPIWFTSLAVGDYVRTHVYQQLQGKKTTLKWRPFLGLIRYCLFDLPFKTRHIPPTDIIFMTVFTWQNGTGRESFYGELPAKLLSDGLKPVLVGKIAEHYHGRMEDIIRKDMVVPAYGPTHLLTKAEGLSCILKGLASFAWMRGSWKDVFYAASFEIPIALVYMKMLEKIYQQSPEARLVFPFEGNAWESACIMASKSKISAGYQHAAILPDQIKITTHTGRPLPMQIITTGSEVGDVLTQFGHDKQNLTDGFTLRQSDIYKFAPKSEPPAKINKMLVLLQGGEDRNGVLDILRHYQRENGDVQITLRPHPAMDISKINTRGFFLSDITRLHEDILAHDACVYTGSTAAMESVYLGVPVIRLAVTGGDPLFSVSYLKKEARTGAEIAAACTFFEGYSNFKDDLRCARSYFEQYFTQPPADMKDKFKKWLSL